MKRQSGPMSDRRLEGYGAGLALEGQQVVIYPGKLLARTSGSTRIAIPTADVVGIEYKAATRLVNGHVTFKVRDESWRTLAGYGGRVFPTLLPPDELESLVKGGMVTPKALVVHWRRRDEAAAAALVDEIRAAVGAARGE